MQAVKANTDYVLCEQKQKVSPFVKGFQQLTHFLIVIMKIFYLTFCGLLSRPQRKSKKCSIKRVVFFLEKQITSENAIEGLKLVLEIS